MVTEESMNKSSASEHLLKISGLTKRFRYGGGVVEAVSGVTLSVDKGDFVAVMGASGSGKSTLLHLAAGLTRPDEGTVHINGTDINTLGDYALTLFRRKSIGLIFQSFNLIPSLTCEENIALPALLGGTGSTSERVRELTTRLGLTGLHGRRPDAMSGGEQQRVAIGRALVSKPSLILADEPTGSLDSANGRKLCNLFGSLCLESGATVLMVTHNPAVAIAASRFVVLKDGRLVGQLNKSDCKTVQDLNQAYVELTEREVAA
jgi:putative ABC transport system ATP-binding protein